MTSLGRTMTKNVRLFISMLKIRQHSTFGSAIDFGPLGDGQGLYIQNGYKNAYGSNTSVNGINRFSVLGIQQRKSFTPEILNVTDRVKAAMLAIEPGSRYSESAYVINFLRNALLQIARVTEDDFTVIPLNGNAALATESVIRAMMSNKKGKLVVVENGIQSRRITNMCKSCGISTIVASHDAKKLQDVMTKNSDISGVVSVHCDPYSGYVIPIKKIGDLSKKCRPDIFHLVEATLTFGALPIKMNNIDFLVSNSGKSLQGAPGIAFVIARKAIMEKHTYHGDSLVMDLTAQYEELQRSGRFRFTPPTHIINAFKEAILELPEEGGVHGRAQRYLENNKILKQGMKEMGFAQLYTDAENPQGYLTTAFNYPANPLFVFEEFQSRISDYGFLICDNEMTPKNSFCISNIGNLNKEDMHKLLQGVRQVLHDMRMPTPILSQNY